MLAEKEIEEKVRGFAVEALKPLTPAVKGSWDIAEDGEVKGTEEPCGSVLAIAVGLRSYDGFDSPQCDIPCAIAFSVRRDIDPTGSDAVEASERLMRLFHSWNADADRVCDDLHTDSFSPAGFRLDGGENTQTADAWTVTINFTLRGVIWESISEEDNN